MAAPLGGQPGARIEMRLTLSAKSSDTHSSCRPATHAGQKVAEPRLRGESSACVGGCMPFMAMRMMRVGRRGGSGADCGKGDGDGLVRATVHPVAVEDVGDCLDVAAAVAGKAEHAKQEEEVQKLRARSMMDQ